MAEPRERTGTLEAASAIIMSIAALASSWATFQAGLWDGEQAAHYSRANAIRIEASRASLEGDALAGVEIQMFTAWLEAKVSHKDQLADFYEARFPPHMQPAFRHWLQDNPLENLTAPPTPFGARGYSRPGLAQSQALNSQAEKTFQQGQYANAVSDSLQQSATILALALFFGGIGQVFQGRAARVGLLTVAGLALIVGLLRLLSLPMQILGFHGPG